MNRFQTCAVLKKCATKPILKHLRTTGSSSPFNEPYGKKYQKIGNEMGTGGHH